MKRSLKTTPKKPYQPPKLLVYGNLTEMTKSGGIHGKRDSGGGRRIRTGA